ncbi:unnamed protein product [Arctogadus glacialis]
MQSSGFCLSAHTATRLSPVLTPDDPGSLTPRASDSRQEQGVHVKHPEVPIVLQQNTDPSLHPTSPSQCGFPRMASCFLEW